MGGSVPDILATYSWVEFCGCVAVLLLPVGILNSGSFKHCLYTLMTSFDYIITIVHVKSSISQLVRHPEAQPMPLLRVTVAKMTLELAVRVRMQGVAQSPMAEGAKRPELALHS
jgi:hypothetical protein